MCVRVCACVQERERGERRRALHSTAVRPAEIVGNMPRPARPLRMQSGLGIPSSSVIGSSFSEAAAAAHAATVSLGHQRATTSLAHAHANIADVCMQSPAAVPPSRGSTASAAATPRATSSMNPSRRDLVLKTPACRKPAVPSPPPRSPTAGQQAAAVGVLSRLGAFKTPPQQQQPLDERCSLGTAVTRSISCCSRLPFGCLGCGCRRSLTQLPPIRHLSLPLQGSILVLQAPRTSAFASAAQVHRCSLSRGALGAAAYAYARWTTAST